MTAANPPVTPFEDTTGLRREVIAACFYMRDRLGYFVGTWATSPCASRTACSSRRRA